METVTDITGKFGETAKRSFKNCTKEARKLSRSLVDFVDVEDVVKSIHKVVHPEEYVERKSNVVHTTIDRSTLHPSPSSQRKSDQSVIQEEREEVNNYFKSPNRTMK